MKYKTTKRRNDKYTCQRHQQHDWEELKVTPTHIIMVCTKCKGKLWKLVTLR